MSSSKNTLKETEIVDVCSYCQNNFKPPNLILFFVMVVKHGFI